MDSDADSMEVALAKQLLGRLGEGGLRLETALVSHEIGQALPPLP